MQKIQHIQTFSGANINLDVDDKVLKNNTFREIYNLICDKFTAHYFPGNKLVTNSSVLANSKYLGGCIDQKRNAFVIFIYHASAPGIYWYYPYDETFRAIMYGSVLNFQEDHPILGANVVGDLLYWTDGYDGGGFGPDDYNPPRKINMIKSSNYLRKAYYNRAVTIHNTYLSYTIDSYVIHIGSAGYYRIFRAKGGWPPMTPSPPLTNTSNNYWQFIEVYNYKDSYLQPITTRVIDRIKYPPIYPPEIANNQTLSLYPDSGTAIFHDGYGMNPSHTVNYLRKKLFRFTYRYVYDDNEQSTWSDISRMPIPHNEEYPDGAMNMDVTFNNVIGLIINTGPEEVKIIEIAAIETTGRIFKIVGRLNKYDENGYKILRSNADISYLFYNDKFSEPLDQNDVMRPFDYVPQISKNQELIEENRLIDADIVEGYDNIEPDVDIEVIHEPKDFTDLEVTLPYQKIVDNFDGNWTYYLTFPEEIIVPGMVIHVAFKMHWSILKHLFGNEDTNPDSDKHCYYVVKEWDTMDTVLDNFMEVFRNVFGKNSDGDYYPIERALPYHNLLKFPEKAYWRYWGFPYWWTYFRVIEDIQTHKVIKDADIWETFKGGSLVGVGLVYHDHADRRGAVITNERMMVNIPFYTYNWLNNEYDIRTVLHRNILRYKINHTPPDWAESYQIVLTKPNIRWFSHYIFSGAHVVYDEATKTTKILINDPVKVFKDFRPLNVYEYYKWEKGDRIRFLSTRWISGSPTEDLNEWVYLDAPIDVEIIGTTYVDDGYGGYLTDKGVDQYGYETWAYVMDENGNKVHDGAKMYILFQDINTTSIVDESFNPNQLFVAEIYRLAKSAADPENEMYYACGEKHPILNPHTPDRCHAGGNSVVTPSVSQDQTRYVPAIGELVGGNNAFMRVRYNGTNYFPIEDYAMSDYFQGELSYMGKVAIIDRSMRRQNLISGMRYGGKFFENTLVNNISRVEWNMIDVLPEKYGAITKIKEVGYTLRVKQPLKMTSIYIGRAGLAQASAEGQDIVASSKEVLGVKITSENDYGLKNPTAYCCSVKDEYFVDVTNGMIIRNAVNGPFPISDYGYKQWTKDKCDYLLNTCSEYRIFAGYDGYHDYAIFTFMGLNGKIWDMSTLVFSERDNAFIAMLDLDVNGDMIDGYLHHGMSLFGFFKGQLYAFNKGNPLEFFGIKRKPRFKFVVNPVPNLVKLFKSISVYSDKKWYAENYGDINIPTSINHINGMRSKLPEAQFESVEGVHRSAFLANSKSTKDTDNLIDLVNGQELRGETMEIELTCDERDEDVKISMVIVNASHSKRSGE